MSEKRREIINSATPEMMGPSEGLPIFFGWAEKNHPQGVKELVGVIGSLMPEGGEAATEHGIKEGLTNSNLDLGFNVISSWLTDVGAEGFRNINWPMRKTFLAAAVAFENRAKISSGEMTKEQYLELVKRVLAAGKAPSA